MIPAAAGPVPDSIPLSALEHTRLGAKPGQPVIFHCRSGGRTARNAALLEEKAAPERTFLLDGGVQGWEAAALPLERP